jgi:hypothetical protein
VPDARRIWKDAANERLWFHDLRAKAITDMKEQGRDAKENFRP